MLSIIEKEQLEADKANSQKGTIRINYFSRQSAINHEEVIDNDSAINNESEEVEETTLFANVSEAECQEENELFEDYSEELENDYCESMDYGISM